MKQEMLINVAQSEECRIAIVEDGVLEELYLERTSQHNYVGNIYKGRIVNLEPSIQAAFVDFGVGRNGFLHLVRVQARPGRSLLPGMRRSPAQHPGHTGTAGAVRLSAASTPAAGQSGRRLSATTPANLIRRNERRIRRPCPRHGHDPGPGRRRTGRTDL